MTSRDTTVPLPCIDRTGTFVGLLSALESEREDAEDGPQHGSTSQAPIHGVDVAARGVNATESSLKLQDGELGEGHGDDCEDAGSV